MSEQAQEERAADQAVSGRDRVLDAMGDALAREAVGLAVLVVIVLAMDPRVRIWLGAAARRLFRGAADARRVAEDHAVAELRKDIADYEHAPKDGGCGCV
jgi:hypothetical protein